MGMQWQSARQAEKFPLVNKDKDGEHNREKRKKK
jgi:hypothetical protein